MCGRYFRHSPRDELAAAFSARPGDDSPAPVGYNIAPSQSILAVRFNPKSGERVIDSLQWGLVPHFATDKKIAWKLTNARSETVDTLPSYRVAYAKRRCLIPADGFYEWRTIGKIKQPYAFALESHKPFAIAGLWENWRDPATGEWLRSCTMITTEANDLVGAVHDRMPVILEPSNYSRWLGDEPGPLLELKGLLRPYDPSRMVSWPLACHASDQQAGRRRRRVAVGHCRGPRGCDAAPGVNAATSTGSAGWGSPVPQLSCRLKREWGRRRATWGAGGYVVATAASSGASGALKRPGDLVRNTSPRPSGGL